MQAKELLVACRDAGVNFFDNAEVYAKGHAEEIMGKAFKVAAAYIIMIYHDALKKKKNVTWECAENKQARPRASMRVDIGAFLCNLSWRGPPGQYKALRQTVSCV